MLKSPSTFLVGLGDIESAQARLAGHIVHTPMVRSVGLSMPGAPVHFKLETRQHTGSFKLRGATNAVLSSTESQRSRGFVTASTGNHGRALACAAKAQGTRAVVCMSHLAPANKIAGVKAFGADVRIIGMSQDDAQVEVRRLVQQEGLTEAPPFDNAAIIAGQGTLGLEIVEDLPEVSLVLVPLSGVAAAVKGCRASTRIVGVSMVRGAAMHASLPPASRCRSRRLKRWRILSAAA